MAMPRDVVVLSDDQFNKLVELLTPSFECAKLMLADYQRQAYERAGYTPYEPANDLRQEDIRTPEQIAADAARQSELEKPASD